MTQTQQIPDPGDRVKITGVMPNDPCPLPIGLEGTVVSTQASVNQIYVDWDVIQGERRSLILLCTDPFEITETAAEVAIRDEHESGAHQGEEAKYAALYCTFCDDLMDTWADLMDTWADQLADEQENR